MNDRGAFVLAGVAVVLVAAVTVAAVYATPLVFELYGDGETEHSARHGPAGRLAHALSGLMPPGERQENSEENCSFAEKYRIINEKRMSLTGCACTTRVTVWKEYELVREWRSRWPYWRSTTLVGVWIW